jgi:hypothetical protein
MSERRAYICGEVVRVIFHPTTGSDSPLTGDEEFIVALAAERDTLRESVARLPHTADGVLVVPLMSVYLLRDGEIDEVTASEIVYRDGQWLVAFDWDYYSLADECYSTREAAKQARGEA